MTHFNSRLPLFFSLLFALLQWPLLAYADSSQRLIQMLDYISVDYPHTVHEGNVVDQVEYTEMQEFSAEVLNLLQQMPENTDKAALISSASAIKQGITRRITGALLAKQTTTLKHQLITVYAVAVGPDHVPNMKKTKALFKSQCSACHGVAGNGNGPLAKDLSPTPSDFHDMKRQQNRSVYDLYNTISLGVAGTPMPAFEKLSDSERWGLAFYVSQFSASDSQRETGKQLWKQGELHNYFQSLSQLTGSSYTDAEQQAVKLNLDKPQGPAVLAYLRSHPEEFEVNDNAAIDKSIEMLAISVAKVRAGDRKGAHEAALSAYLDGFELAEHSLVVADAQLKKQIEKNMIAFRELSKNGQITELEITQTKLIDLLQKAKNTLSTTRMSTTSAFFGSFIILLREGVEAILVLAAIMAALIKTGRKEAIKYIHAGWISAIVLGIFTWWIAENLISVSGASRETTEGIAALLAAAILVYVGFWLHNASHSQRWQKFVQHKVNNAMENSTLWILATVSFLAVYREMFETVLFYQAIWIQVESGSEHGFLMGIAAAVALLVIIAFLIFRVGTRLPIKQFFQINAVLLFLLAVIFTGQGIAALQEAGKISANLLDSPTIEILGIYPTIQGLILQLIVLLLGAGMLLYQKKSGSQKV